MFMALTTGSSTNLAFTLVVISASPTTALAGLSVRWVQPPNAMAAEPISAAVIRDLVFILGLLRVVGDGESRGNARASHVARIGSAAPPLCRKGTLRGGSALRFPRGTTPTRAGRSATTRGCDGRRRFCRRAATTMLRTKFPLEEDMDTQRSK